jgi:DNA-3-methyladenine glycosylase II
VIFMTQLRGSSALVVPSAALRQAVDAVCEGDRDFLQIEQVAGVLSVRREAASFAALVRIVLGQQLSAKAAQAIFLRLNTLLDLTPTELANCSEVRLKEVGLSRAKIITCKQLADALLAGTLDLDQLSLLSDDQIIAELTRIKGIGNWTAQIYLLFCLERLNSFPASDLAIQVGYQRLKQLHHRPLPKELIGLLQPLEPYRGAAAHLLWHYYRFLSQP